MTTNLEETLKGRHRPAHAERTAQTHATFLLPHLAPGMALLDLGCGPGTITVGLAAAIAPGPTTGVDLDPALPAGTDGVTLVTADACDLPLPDASVDAVYAGALLQHLPDPLAALREARRVARPGAVIGVADADWGGYLLAPEDPVLHGSFRLMERLRTGNPRVGRELRDLLTRAGFVRARAQARATCHGTPEEVRGFAEFTASFFTTPAVANRLVAGGSATEAELAAAAQAWRAWGEHPGAFFAGFWCEALAWAD